MKVYLGCVSQPYKCKTILLQMQDNSTTITKLKYNLIEVVLRQIRKTTEKPPRALDVAKKHVETYSSSNAAAQKPEERVKIVKTAHNKKVNRQGD